MKTLVPLILPLILLLFLGCNSPTDDNQTTGGPDTSSVIDNVGGKYNGLWRVVHDYETHLEALTFEIDTEYNYEKRYVDTASYPDTMNMVRITDDSLLLYFYDSGEVAYVCEPFLFDTLLYLVTDWDIEEIDAEVLEMEGDVHNAVYRENSSITQIIKKDDTLKVTYNYRVDMDFDSTIWNSSGGNLVARSSYEFIMLSYNGSMPPSHWPDSMVYDSDEEDDGDEAESED